MTFRIISATANRHKRGLSRRAVAGWLTVCPSVCHVRVFYQNEWIYPQTFCRAMLCTSKHGLPSCDVCLSRSWILSKRINIIIFTIFFHRGIAKLFWVFHTKRHGDNPTETPNRNVESRWGRQTSRFPTNNWLHRVLSTLRPPGVNTVPPDRGKFVTWPLSPCYSAILFPLCNISLKLDNPLLSYGLP